MNAHQMHAVCAGILNTADDLNRLAIEEKDPDLRAQLFGMSSNQQKLIQTITMMPLDATTERDPFRPTTHRVVKGKR